MGKSIKGCRSGLLVTVLLAIISMSTATNWDHFVFAQAWPPATCAKAPEQKHTCYMSKDVTSWSIHGLWPSLGRTDRPKFCDNSSKFDFNQIADLKDQMMKYWPNLYNKTFDDSFWRREWMEHGTCCEDLEATSGEHNYFRTALDMNRKFNLLTILEQHGITPSDSRLYKMKNIVDAIQNTVGVKPTISCNRLSNVDSNKIIIDQVKICFRKDLKPMDCPRGNATFTRQESAGELADIIPTGCPQDFYYPPIRYS